MATTILCVGDPHFRHDNFEETKQMQEGLVSLIEERRPSYVAIMGDILDRHEKINLFQMSRALQFLQSIKRQLDVYNGSLIVLIGNHDRPNNTQYEAHDHVFSSLSLWTNTFIVDSPRNIIDGTCNLLAIPFLPLNSFYTTIFQKELENVDIVLCHQEFRGARMGPHTSDSVDVWLESYPPCVSGHIHDYQKVGSNLTYVGTPFQHGYHEGGEKTVSLFTLSPFSPLQEERVSLNIRRKQLLTLSAKEFASFEPKDNIKYRIKVKGTTREVHEAMKSQKASTLIDLGVDIKPQSERIESYHLSPFPSPSQPRLSFHEVLTQQLKDNHPSLLSVLHKL